MKKHIHVISFVLLMALVLTAVACAAPEIPDETAGTTPVADLPDNATPTETTTAPQPEETTPAVVSDDIGDVNFGGKDFRIYAQHRFKSYAAATEQIGETINDAVYTRNTLVEDRLGVSLVFSFGEEEKMCQDFSTTVMSGVDAYDLFLGHGVYSSKYFTQGIYSNWYDTDIDFSKPWFPEYVVKCSTINNKMYLLLSDVCLSAVARVYSIFYNITEGNNYGFPDVFELVDKKEWTLDKMIELTANVYRDNNTNGQRDVDDFYGTRATSNGNYICNYIYSLGMDNVIITQDCEVIDNFGSELNITKLEKLFYMFEDTEGGYIKDSFEESWKSFSQGNVIFNHGSLEWGQTYYKNQCDFEYGIIPFPTYTSDQPYLTKVNGAASMTSLPATAKDYEMIKAVLTVMCAETYNNVIPQYIGETLQGKVAENAETAEMITLILDGRTMDFAAIYDAFVGYTYNLDGVMAARGKLASYFKTRTRTIVKHYSNIAAAFNK